MAHRAGRIIHRGVVGVGKGHRVSGSRSRFFYIYPEEVIVSPASPSAIAIGISGWISAHPSHCAEHAGMWPLMIIRPINELSCLIVEVEGWRPRNMAPVTTRLIGIELVFFKKTVFVDIISVEAEASPVCNI